ncbi:MAG TPA: hypothetical protein VFV50_12035 [Bdellovibrionales bacterium]|nr:hypothetical protein [Bdellovibrionales bacterium]
MKHLLFTIALMTAGPGFAAAEVPDFNPETEPSAEETAAPPVRPHISEEECKAVELGDLKFRARTESGNLYVAIQQGDKRVGRFDPLLDGPGSKCLKLKEFKDEKIIALELCHGLAGTSVLVERHSLLILKLEGRKLRVIGDVDLKYTEREGDSFRSEFDRSYKLKRKDGRIVVTTKERNTKRETTFQF